jgi:myo-inositol-1(or 4)-monophosphatase
VQLDQYLQAAEEAARAGGRVLLGWAGKFDVRLKGRADLVTSADLDSQKTIRDLLLGRFPDHGFLGEEEGNRANRDGEYRWIVDPLDGTTNYVHGVPFYAVSIALERRGKPLVGVIYDPVRNHCYRAAAGMGAWLDDEPLRVSQTDSLDDALVVTSFPPGVGRRDRQVEHFLRVLVRSQSVRRTGSAAMNLAYVAAGRFDAFWSNSLHPWDLAAGVLLVAEAGGRTTGIEGDRFEIASPELLASNGTHLHEVLTALFSSCDGTE